MLRSAATLNRTCLQKDKTMTEPTTRNTIPASPEAARRYYVSTQHQEPSDNRNSASLV